MKRIPIVAMLLVITIVFASCAKVGTNMMLLENDRTFQKIVAEIREQDSYSLTKIFAPSVYSEEELLQNAFILIEYIRGDVVSFSSAAERGVGADYEKNDGKGKKEIHSSFCLETTETRYYIAIRECVINDFDNRGIGVISLYIIEASNWEEDYVYRGGGNWTPGIVIDIPS